jgi:hypothetical protein
MLHDSGLGLIEIGFVIGHNSLRLVLDIGILLKKAKLRLLVYSVNSLFEFLFDKVPRHENI